MEFFIKIILPAALWRGVDSASYRNEYREYFLGGKCGLCLGLPNLLPYCADCHEIASTSLNPQGLSRPVQRLLCSYTVSSSLHGYPQAHLSSPKHKTRQSHHLSYPYHTQNTSRISLFTLIQTFFTTYKMVRNVFSAICCPSMFSV